MATSKGAALQPAWWEEIAGDMAHLGIAHVVVIEDAGAWQPVVFHFVPDPIVAMRGSVDSIQAVTIPWMLAARPSEAAAWSALEWFLKGIAAVRKRVASEFPWAEDPRGDRAVLRNKVIDAWDSYRAATHDYGMEAVDGQG